MTAMSPHDARRNELLAAKARMRTVILANRRRLPQPARLAAGNAIWHQLRGWLAAGPASVVAAYAPFGAEPGGVALVERLASTVSTLLLPVVDGRELHWFRYESAAGLRAVGRMWEPVPTGDPVAISAADVVVVPAVAVAVNGVRLGRGGGFYDRVLPQVTGRSVALLYDGEFVVELPTEPHDARVATVITPGRGVSEISLALDA